MTTKDVTKRPVEQSAQVAALPAVGVIAEMAARYGMDKDAFERTLRATVVPSETSKEQFAAFLLVAKEYGLNPVIKQIYAFPAKGGGIQPIVSIDGWIHMAINHPEFDGMEFTDIIDDGKLIAIACRMFRKDRQRAVEVTEYMSECRRETDVWKKYPARMLRHKATIQCARYAFGFAGIVDPDEFERNVTAEAEVVDRQPLRAQVQRKSAVTVEAEPVEQQTDGPSLESFLNDVLSAPDTAELDAIAADAEKNLSGSALKAVKDAIKNRRDEMTKGEQP